MPSVLQVRNLYLHYETRKGPVKAVDNLNFDLERGHTLALVGESGCGKTSAAIAILRLLPKNVAKYDGHVLLEGRETMDLRDEEFRKQVRWRGISMVFQGAMNALNPTSKVGYQVAEPLMIHLDLRAEEAGARVREALNSVRLPEYVEKSYPHELSGGMKQRVIIAMALIMNPSIVILDEPTSALDVMTQANIINLLKRLKREENLSYIFITHDFSLASELADDVGIMYAGELVEIGPAEKIYTDPQHPYTKGLLGSVPKLRSTVAPTFIPGVPPDLVEPPLGCRFHPRCPVSFEDCGWSADEVAEDLRKALSEKAGDEGMQLDEMEVVDAFTLVLPPSDGGNAEAWERSIKDTISLESDQLRSFQSIRTVQVEDGQLVLRLAQGKTPEMVGEDQRAACLLLTKGGS